MVGRSYCFPYIVSGAAVLSVKFTSLRQGKYQISHSEPSQEWGQSGSEQCHKAYALSAPCQTPNRQGMRLRQLASRRDTAL